MWWGDLQQQMELNNKEVERKARQAWMWAGHGCKPCWLSKLMMALVNRIPKGKDREC